LLRKTTFFKLLKVGIGVVIVIDVPSLSNIADIGVFKVNVKKEVFI
jgi:hypothetical protein